MTVQSKMASKSTVGMLSASPSWYCSRVSDCHPKGVFIYGAKNSVYVLDITNNNENSPNYLTSVEVHHDRVTSLSVNQHDHNKIVCCTASDDKKVRIWDIDSKELREEHSYHKVCS